MPPRRVVERSTLATVLTPRGTRVSKADLGDADTRALMAELTVRPKVARGFPPAESFPTFLESPSSLFIPRAFARQRFGAPASTTITTPERRPALKFAGELRPQQALAVDAYLAGPGEGTVCLPCGGGKTCIALNVVARLGVKTAVVVHKEFLMTQWRERIDQFLPGASVGIVRGPKVDVAERDIVMISLQSLTKRDYGDALSGFGLAIFDESHHLGARVFCRALRQTNFRHVLALTATPERKDGLERVFHWTLGDIVWRPPSVVARPSVTVRRVTNPHPVDAVLDRSGARIDRVATITALCADARRTEFVARLAVDIRVAEPGRCVLLLSERRSHLVDLHAALIGAGIPESVMGYYVGGMTAAARQVTETEKDVVLASFAQCSEGADIPRLDSLVLCSPRSDVVQSVGRIMRKEGGAPLIVDVQDQHFEGSARARRTTYRKAGYTIVDGVQTQCDGENSDGEDGSRPCMFSA